MCQHSFAAYFPYFYLQTGCLQIFIKSFKVVQTLRIIERSEGNYGINMEFDFKLLFAP